MILARSFNIPTLVGVDIDALTPWQQQTIYIDGNAGAIVVEPGEAVARYYQQEARVQDALREQQRVWLTQQARTADGIRIEIAANIAHSVEAQAAFGNGAEGVGLFRTEMLYMDRTSAHRAKASCTTFFVRRWNPPTDAALLCALWTLAATNPLII